MNKMQVADCHNDMLLAIRHQRERGQQDPFGDFWLPQLVQGGVRFQVLPVCTEEQFVGEGALRRAMLLIEEARHLARVHEDRVAIVETTEELDRTQSEGRIALVLALEGAEPVGNSLELIDSFYKAGVRMASMSWNRRTMMADGVAESDTGGRLTQLGVDAVARMEELGMVVDVSHLSRAGFFHVAEIATRPFIASHSSCTSVHAHPRNLDDEQLKIMRDRESIVCLNAFGPFLADAPDVEAYLRHIDHALNQLGPTNVGLGTDFIDDVTKVCDPIFTGLLTPIDSIPQVQNLKRPSDFADLTASLTTKFGEATARAVASENLVEFMRRALV